MPTTATPLLLTDPGYLYWAPFGTTEPTWAVTASIFSDVTPVAFINLGATAEGSEFTASTSVEAIRVAELFDPIRYSTTERASSIAFAMADVTLNNFKRAMNGGTIVTTGATTTTMSIMEPVAPGAEVRCMIMWEAQDGTVRILIRQCFQGGEMKLENRKAPAFASIPVEFQAEKPTGLQPFKIGTAGVARLGT